MNRKIGFLISDYTPGGGVERVTANLMNIFLENGIEIDCLISLDKAFDQPKIHYPNQVPIHVLDCKNYSEIVSKLSSFFKENPLDDLIFEGGNLTISLNVLKVCKEFNVNTFPQFHGSPKTYYTKYIFKNDLTTKPLLIFKIIWGKIEKPFKISRLKRYLKKSNGIYFVSNGAAQEFRELFKNLPLTETKKIKAIPNPITFRKSNDAVHKKRNQIIFVGRLEKKHKNAFMPLLVWQQLFKGFPDWEFLIAGHGSLFEPMKLFAEENEIKNVQLLGWVSKVENLLKESSILVSPSHCEGFSLVVSEACQFNNAIVATDSDGGVKDMVEHGFNGLISPKNDVNHMVKNLRILMSNHDKLEKMQKNSPKKVEGFYPDIIFKMWQDEMGL